MAEAGDIGVVGFGQAHGAVDGAYGAQILEGGQELAQHLGGFRGAEDGQAPELARAAVQVEVSDELVEGGLGRFGHAEVGLHVGLAAQEALLLAVEEHDPHGALGLGAGGFQEAQHLHHHGAVGGIVRGAGGGVPGIQVGAQQHHFLGLLGPREFGHHIQALGELGVHAVADVQLQAGLAAAFHETPHPPVVLPAHHRGGHGLGQVVGAVVEGADLAVAQTRVVHPGQGACLHQEGIDALVDLPGREGAGPLGAGAAGDAAGGLDLCGVEALLEGCFLVAVAGGSREHGQGFGRAHEDHLALHGGGLALQEDVEFIRQGLLGHREARHVTLHGAPGGGRPGHGLHHEGILEGFQGVDRAALVGPARMTEGEGFDPRLVRAPGLELLHGPLGCGLVAGRGHEPGAVHIRELVQGGHHLAAFQALLPQGRHAGCIQGFCSLGGQQDGNQGKERGEAHGPSGCIVLLGYQGGIRREAVI
ncbi:MAG: hypothetical protein BWY56_02029 [Acidobacteria bacterium ADurb.Bin340]|nr:MAG: hypothetical protein BWY56_02029 [Acidobacteria bacterium ADurb.Bin340]